MLFDSVFTYNLTSNTVQSEELTVSLYKLENHSLLCVTDAEPSLYLDHDGSLKGRGYNFLDISSDGVHPHNGSEDLVNSSVRSMPDLCTAEKIKNIQRPSSTDVLLSDGSGVGDFIDQDPGINKPEFFSISIVKGAMGFGFTIADSAYGQKVKKILDRQRCKNLMEGDILVDINAISVRTMCHGEVVQVLKDCSRNQEATVTVQRGGPGSPGKNRPRKKDEPGLTLGLGGANSSSGGGSAIGRKPNVGSSGSTAGMYRSKTPTADLYSTQQKEVIPNRPKTPLVDTRNRSKTPTSERDRRPWSPSEGGESAMLDIGLGGTGVSKCDENGADGISSLKSPSSPLTPPYDSYKTAFTYPDPYDGGGRSPLANLSDRLGVASLQDPIRPVHGDYSRSRGLENDLDPDLDPDSNPDSGALQQRDAWNKVHDGHYGDSYSSENATHSPFTGTYEATVVDHASVPNNRPPSTDYLGHYVPQPYYNGYGGQYESGYVYSYADVHSGYLPHRDFGYPHPASQGQNVPSGTIALANSGYYTATDIANKRKESTSFEHEQPHPSTVTR